MKTGNEAGFTLLEIIVAVTILAITFTTIFGFYGRSLRAIETSEKYARAAVLAKQKMDEVLAAQPLQAGSGSGYFEENPDFSWKTDVGDYGAPIGRLEKGILAESPEKAVTRKISVIVEWAEGGTQKSLALETLKTSVEETR